MIKLNFKNGIVEDYTIVLSTRDYRHLGQLCLLKDANYTRNLNSANEIHFSLTKSDFINLDERIDDKDIEKYKKVKNELWEQIVDFKLIWIRELNEYFEIKVSTEDSMDISKTITATSLCETELSQVKISAEINSESDILRDDYEITVFYDENNTKASLLHRILQKVPNYRVKYVDDSLKRMQRTFSINNSSIYEFLVGECSEQFNCLFQFDSSDRTISVYDLYTVCNDCGERGDYYDECPNCHSNNLKHFGQDTTIYVDSTNLTDSIHLEANADNVKNCFKLVAGDDLMTATVRMLNMNGSDYIIYVSEAQKKDMPSELIDKLNSYDELYESYNDEYEQLVNDIYDLSDDILYKESSMMPTIEHSEITATTEALKLTEMNLSPLGLSSVTTSTSIATVNSALINYAKVHVKTGYVKIEIDDDATFEVAVDENGKEAVDANGYYYGAWHGRFTVTNYSDEEDVVKTNYLTIKVYDNYKEFVEQSIMKNISQSDEDDGSVFDVLNIEDLEDFKSALKLYCKNRLKSFFDAINGALTVLMKLDQASENADLYEALYIPYYDKLQACQAELDIRQNEINELQMQLDEKESALKNIQSILDFESYLGEYYNIFCSYRREDTYDNKNYISDGLNNAEIIQRAKEFIQIAKKELYKSAEQQISISTSLYNLLVIPQFAPIINDFKLGNWIRIKVDGKLYKLHLIGYSINFSDIQTLTVEFANVSKIKSAINDVEQIIQSAKTMSSTYGYVEKQAEKGNVAQENIESWKQNGFNTSLYQIKSNVNEEVTWGKSGLLCRAYDDISGTYDDEQFILTHNILAYTDNAMQSIKCALGKHSYSAYNPDTSQFESYMGYGLSADFVIAGHIIGSQFIGGEIYSDNYVPNVSGTYQNLRNGDFQLAGGKFVYNSSTNELTVKNVNIDWSTSTNPSVSNVNGLSESLDGLVTSDSLNEVVDRIDSVNSDLQNKYNTITKYFTFNVNGLIIGEVDNPYKVIIDNDRYSMTVDNVEVLWIDGITGEVHTPNITITNQMNLMGYVITDDEENEIINCTWGDDE